MEPDTPKPEDRPIEQIVARTHVLVDGDMSPNKLLTLVKLLREEERLDYKAEYNPAKNPKDKIEFVRDVVGMANTFGGYIVYGVRETLNEDSPRYLPEGLTPEMCNGLDISKLRELVESFVSERTNIQFQLHVLPELDDRSFGLLYVPPSLNSPLVLTKDGQYRDPRSGKSEVLFRNGDIVVRKGASTDRADQSDMRRLLSDARRREKDAWTEEILGLRELTQRLDVLIQVMTQGAQPNPSGEQPAYALKRVTGLTTTYDETWLYLSPASFHDRILDLLEGQHQVLIRRYLQAVPQAFFKHVAEVSTGDDSQFLEIRDNRLLAILDNLLAMGVACVEYAQAELFSEVQKALYLLCRQAEKIKFPVMTDASLSFDKIWVWQEVIVRVYTLGALSIYREQWALAEALIRQEIDWDSYYRPFYWSRYFLIEASRAGRLQHKGWVPSVVNYIESNQWLAALFMTDKDEITSAACQFDFLQCVYVAVNNSGDVTRAYPSFGLYYTHRTEPVISKLITPGKLRDSVAGISDSQLAQIIRKLDQLAATEFFAHNAWDAGEWSDERIAQFVQSNLTQ